MATDNRHPAMRQLAQFVLSNRCSHVAAPVKEAVQKSILDLLGCAMLGVSEKGPQAIRDDLADTFPSGTVPVWFTSQQSSAIGAATANASAASTMDLDDGHRLARGHPGAAVIPAVLARAFEQDVAAERVLAAIYIGYEVGITIAIARTSYGGSGTWAAAAVVAGLAALDNTDLEILEHALAIAIETAPNQAFQSSPAPRNPPPEGSHVKEGIAFAVECGFKALSRARKGHTGPRNILQSDRLYRPFPEDFELGVSPHICSTYLKLYTSCRHTHPPIDAIRQVLARNTIQAETIDAIKVEIYSGALRITNKCEPSNTIDVQYSIPYAIGLVVVAGSHTLLPVTEEALAHVGALAIAQKVELVLYEDFDVLFPAQTLCRVSVVCDQQTFVSDVTAPKGEATNPLSWDEVAEKLKTATRLVANEEKQDRLIAAVQRVADGTLRPLMEVLGNSAASR